MTQRKNLAVLAVVGFFAARVTWADVALPAIFSDHMVLQQGLPVAIWGTADKGEAIRVSYRGQTKTTTADAQGTWRVTLDKLVAEADQKGDELVVAGKNKLVFADVVVGEVWLGSGQSNMAWADFKKPEDLAAANLPQVRFYSQTQWPSYQTKGWQACTPETIKPFSSIMFYFGTKLHQDLKVPVGLIATGTGGSPAKTWITNEAFLADPECKQAWQRYGSELHPALQNQYEAALAKWEKDMATSRPGAKPPRKPGAPVSPESPACGQWYDKFVAPLAGYTLRGVVWDQGEAGSGLPGVELDTITVALAGSWRKTWGQDFVWLYVQKPSGGGWEWTPERKDAKGQPVPRPVLPKSPADVAAGGYGREAFLKLARVPNSALCVAVDLGGGLHPTTKNLYGRRLAQMAEGKVYGQPVIWEGPVYAGHSVEGSQVRIRFRNTGGGLVPLGGEPVQGFAVAGADRQFVWANAKIEGEEVVVRSEGVAVPMAVRYAWAESPNWANLAGKNGWPVVTFRTDGWAREVGQGKAGH